MGIKYYPNRVFKKQSPAIDRVMAKRAPKKVSGTQSVAATALSQTISSQSDWTVDSIALTFSAAVARNYRFIIKNGRAVVENLNDYLWFQIPTTLPQKIQLTPGFYNGTELAAMLKVQMDSNTAFNDAGVTFNVVYTASTGLYTITPSAGTMKYIDVNYSQTLPNRDSIAGHLFGFNETTAYAASIDSDTVVAGLNQETILIEQTGSVVLHHYHDDPHTLSVDEALVVEVDSVGGLSVDWTVVYEEII